MYSVVYNREKLLLAKISDSESMAVSIMIISMIYGHQKWCHGSILIYMEDV